jgi:hypothetical protein
MKTNVQPLLDIVKNELLTSLKKDQIMRRKILDELEKEKRKWIYNI